MAHKIKAVVLTGYGGYDQIQVTYLKPPPKPQGSEVKIQVAACGMNFADIYTRQGLIRDKTLPFIMGIECAGIILEVGDLVQNLQEGDRVMCYNGSHGMYAEEIIASETWCTKMPTDMTFVEGAAFVSNYLTAYFSLFDIGNLKPGQKVLIHSAGGGVGFAATQLAKTVDKVTVIGTASQFKHNDILSNGVDHAIEYDNYEQAVREIAPEGVEIILDSMGGKESFVSERLLRPLGKTVLLGVSSMIQGEKLSMWQLLWAWWYSWSPNATSLVVNNHVVGGLHLAYLLRDDPRRFQQGMESLLQLYQEGKIKVRCHIVLPFDKVVDAGKMLANRQNIGKVILIPRDM